MEQKLKRLFDYQKFARNPRLDAMLSEAEGRYDHAVSDDDLELVSAAGNSQFEDYVYPSEQLEANSAASDQTTIPVVLLPLEDQR